MGRVTSAEVARAAGVSQSAVSRVFTSGAPVSVKTAERVRKAAGRLGYRPNALARSLITGESRIIGLAMAELDNQFYPEILKLLSCGLQESGYHILVFMASGDDTETETVISELLDYQVDALIAASVALTTPLAERCRAQGIPVLLLNRHQGNSGPPSVASDNVGGARRMTEFLLRVGHERIAHISGWQGSSTGRERRQGFLQALAAAGRSAAACVDGMFDQEIVRRITRELFTAGDIRPDALFVGSDNMAFAAMDVLRFELGIRVPEEVSVTGFDDVPMAAWPAYSLTTMRQPLDKMIREAVRHITGCIGNPSTEPPQIRLKCDLCVRGSSRPLSRMEEKK